MKTNETMSTFFEHIGLRFTENNHVTGQMLEMPAAPHMLQDDGTVHPGVFAAMLDTSLGAFISRTFDSFATTINLNMTYHALEPEETYQASAEVLAKEGKYISAEGKITDQDGKLIASAIGTFKIQ